MGVLEGWTGELKKVRDGTNINIIQDGHESIPQRPSSWEVRSLFLSLSFLATPPISPLLLPLTSTCAVLDPHRIRLPHNHSILLPHTRLLPPPLPLAVLPALVDAQPVDPLRSSVAHPLVLRLLRGMGREKALAYE